MWLILLAGCRNAELSAFLDDRAAAICERHERCGTLEDAGFADIKACELALASADRTLASHGQLGCPGFDASAADTCLAAWDADCETPPDLAVCEAVCP
jgi:hypothetical protein